MSPRTRTLLQAAGISAMLCVVGLVLLGTRAPQTHTVLEYTLPGAVVYQANGAYPLAHQPNTAAALRPLDYRGNGQFPEKMPPNPSVIF